MRLQFFNSAVIANSKKGYSFPALYFVYLAIFFNWVSCLLPNLKFSSFSAFHGNELGSILLHHRIKKISGFSVHTTADS